MFWAPELQPNASHLIKAFQGLSESILGQRELASEFTIDTKAATGLSEGSGRNILQSAKESMEALQTTKVLVPSSYRDGLPDGIQLLTK